MIRRAAMKTTTLIIVCHIIAAQGKEVCYGDLGCFSDAPPWSGTLQRVEAALPWSPEKINTQFYLLTRENPERHQNLSVRDVAGLAASAFRTSRRTIFIVHGMGDRAKNNWVSIMCHELLMAEDVNCIGVDWRRGSGNVLLYVQAANNGRLVGAEIARLLKTLQEDLSYPPSEVHIIGHSLGAHIAGEAGRRFRGIRRITGLDPARPYFNNVDPEVALDPSDAAFVDVIHTDTSAITGVGIAKPIGHFDFYPNGGKRMAGCPHKLTAFLWNKDDMLETLACDHFRSFCYYTHSIRSPAGFIAYPCEKYEEFTSGSCFPCPPHNCPPMGHHSEEYYNGTEPRRKFYLNTGESAPNFSSWRYKVSLSLDGTKRTFGAIYVSLYGAECNVTELQLKRGRLYPGTTYSEFVDSPAALHPLSHVTFHWTPVITNMFSRELRAARIEIQAGDTGAKSAFCGAGMVLDNEVQLLSPCDDQEGP